MEHWLESIADYPESIWQKKENASGHLHEIVARRQRERMLKDAVSLPQLRRTLPGNKNTDMTLWINGLFPLPLSPLKTEGEQGPDSSPLLLPARAPSRLNSPQRALSMIISAAGEILPCDEHGDMPFSTGAKITPALFHAIIRHDLEEAEKSRNATTGEGRVLKALSIMPDGYVRTQCRWPNGRIDMHFSVTLTDAEGKRRENMTAVRMFSHILPLRFNVRLKAYEIYDINHEDIPGYPVCHDAASLWRFGRITGHQYHERTAVSMAIYSHISVRLYKLLMGNLNELCKSVTDITPVNSNGIVRDGKDNDYLMMDNHYIKMIKGPGENVFFLRGDNNIQLKIRFDNKKKRFVYLPEDNSLYFSQDKPLAPELLKNAADSSLSYRQGFRSSDIAAGSLALLAEQRLAYSGLKKIIYFGLSDEEVALHPQYAPQSETLRKTLSQCETIVGELRTKPAQPALRDALYTALHITGAGAKAKCRAWSLFEDNLAKLQTLLDSHARDGYRRVWGASFATFTTALISQKSDPLKRLWFNVRFRQPNAPHNGYLAQYCHYGCKEIQLKENTAILSRSAGKERVPQEDAFVNPVYRDDFPKLMARLERGSMSVNEIDSLAGLPEATGIQHLAFLSDKMMAKRLFRSKATARIKMILTDADKFSHLLLHLHAAMNNRSCEHAYPEPVRMSLFMLAWQGL
ncbi:hypothetical protein ABK905_23755 [Acerihabitans sp. KWT182]|uniref:Uncharacterized protein n=1 Tax=Acerihabitans sp. KWT182 TaxID=3157919 RepID=A0AAU7Q924_9GAMM